MIGNDIIDFKEASLESNWKRRGYLDKVFSELEKDQIYHSLKPERTLWTIWSMKEAACKANQRRFDLPRFYEPSVFEVKLDSNSEFETKGTIIYENHQYRGIAEINSDYIHCLVSLIPKNQIIQKIKRNSFNPHEDLMKIFSKRFDCSLEKLKLEKDENGIPWLLVKGERSSLPFSISHHGRFSAFTLANKKFI